ncbi:hypothetical protein [Calothrix sp. UHCC 0171]|uniref:hypothetical protein n=1 Tax=Calothrix sp. UHCC 0171 TaxID=3110245 RepID=UPI002B220787|nr:hypothetical protein [Calothrix sp. UHCC 0171]MEA5574588.1 hypothetical protein [Calothrix sp. UHCC 0171]
MKKLAGFTVLGVTIALSSTFYLGQSSRPFNLIGVKFCPKTANYTKNSNYTPASQAQQQLDHKYCQFEHKLLKEVWDNQQFQASKPIPESSLFSRDIPAIQSGVAWFLVAPVSMGIAYLSWAKKCEDEETYFYQLLQDFKIQVSLTGASTRSEIDFKSQSIRNNWDKQRVKVGFISVEGMQDKLRRQQELQDKTHTSTIKQFDLADSDMDKKISENLRDKYKADKESDKMLGARDKDSNNDDDANSNLSDKELANQLINALKQHEDGWLWYLVESFTPIIIWGKAGSYKSYTAACIALLKHFLIDAKIQAIADIDFDQNKEDSWKYLIPLEPVIYGTGIDWEDYENAYLDAIERSKVRTLKDKPIVSIWDELTNANGKFENAKNIVPFVIATPRKRNEHCILLSHNLTQACLGGCESISEPIKTQTYRLNLKTNPQAKPLFKGVLEGLVDDDGNELEQHQVSLPKWFRPEIIWGHFHGKAIKFD